MHGADQWKQPKCRLFGIGVHKIYISVKCEWKLPHYFYWDMHFISSPTKWRPFVQGTISDNHIILKCAPKLLSNDWLMMQEKIKSFLVQDYSSTTIRCTVFSFNSLASIYDLWFQSRDLECILGHRISWATSTNSPRANAIGADTPTLVQVMARCPGNRSWGKPPA